MFTELEQKLIRLAMDAAAQPGERDNCATKLIESLRKRGISSEQFIKLSGVQPPPHQHTVNGRCPVCGAVKARPYVFDFGKHRGKRLGDPDVTDDYLQWCLVNLTDKPVLIAAIKRYFNMP